MMQFWSLVLFSIIQFLSTKKIVVRNLPIILIKTFELRT